MPTRRLARPVLAVAFVAALALPLAPTAAFAHDALVDSDPADGATVAALEHVTLTFSSDPLDGEGASLVEVIGPDERHYETECPEIVGTDVTTPVELGGAGEYEIVFKVVSSDGHPVSGSQSFTYEPKAGAAPAEGSAAATCGAPSTPTATSAPSATPTQTAAPTPTASERPAEGGGLGQEFWLMLAAAAIVPVGVGYWLALRSSRRRSDN
ncbi:MAG: copper resistance protein CopC [Microbacterium sp.]|uniref:copper resistance CopC family protein n=1 Tax=Microbacterium sp. TaxID=51671 RepID=UPI0039E418BB